MTQTLIDNAIVGLLSLVAFTTLIWLMSLTKKDASIIDRFWGFLFVLQTLVYIGLSQNFSIRNLVLSSLVIVWGLRLSIHIYLRNRHHGEDKRYTAMREEHGPKKFWWYSFFSVFILQAILAFLIGLPILLVNGQTYVAEWTVFDTFGVLIWSLGFYFEVIGDRQLKAFKEKSENRGKLITSGLWSLSRHPNYFGDACLWWGYFFFALSVPFGLWSFIGPLAMSLFIYHVSGVKLLEKSLRLRYPEFAEYERTTPAFIPNFFRLLR